MSTSNHRDSSDRILPDVPEIREQYPLYDGLLAYFPAALCEVARWSKVGGAKYNKDKLRWVREESTDHENKIIRHLLDARHKNEEGFFEAVGMAWRALALLQSILEEDGWAEGANGRRAEPISSSHNRHGNTTRYSAHPSHPDAIEVFDVSDFKPSYGEGSTHSG